MRAIVQGRDERRGREQRAARRATEATGHMTASAYDCAPHAEPPGFTIRPLLSTLPINFNYLWETPFWTAFVTRS